MAPKERRGTVPSPGESQRKRNEVSSPSILLTGTKGSKDVPSPNLTPLRMEGFDPAMVTSESIQRSLERGKLRGFGLVVPFDVSAASFWRFETEDNQSGGFEAG